MHRTAILALHYQNEVLHPDGLIRVGVDDEAVRARVIDGATRLLANARQRRLPIYHVRIAFRPDYADCPANTPIFRRTMELGAVKEGEWGAQFIDSLQPRPSPDEFVITHQRISAFAGTNLDDLLRIRQINRLVIAGVATHSVVDHSTRAAVDLGYEVIVAADASASGTPEFHDAALRSLALIAKIAGVDEVFR
jgi:nicotinamidase-related amidase